MYGADGVDFTPEARRQIAPVHRLGPWQPADLRRQDATSRSPPTPASWAALPASASTSVSVRPAAGAGFLIAYLGAIRTMPGLPSEPAANHVDIDEHGAVMGLF